MKLYLVSYDLLAGRRYVNFQIPVYAENAKEACAYVKTRYWDKVNAYMARHGCTTQTARRQFKFPFHVSAKRMED